MPPPAATRVHFGTAACPSCFSGTCRFLYQSSVHASNLGNVKARSSGDHGCHSGCGGSDMTGVSGCLRLTVAAVMAITSGGTAVAWASSPGGPGPQSTRRSAALQISVVVSPSCTVRSAAESPETPPSFACIRGALPPGFAPRVEIVSPPSRVSGDVPPDLSPSVPRPMGPAQDGTGALAPSGDRLPSPPNPVRVIHF
jgi:hypothetical protein